MILANLMFLAPLKDLQTAVSKGTGLEDLNPTPWAFMLGNCLGWTVYGVLAKDWWIFWADAPGFLISCWLNLGAVKLMYSSHHQKETQSSLVKFLASKEMEKEKGSRTLFQSQHQLQQEMLQHRDQDMYSSDDESYTERIDPLFDDGEEKDGSYKEGMLENEEQDKKSYTEKIFPAIDEDEETKDEMPEEEIVFFTEESKEVDEVEIPGVAQNLADYVAPLTDPEVFAERSEKPVSKNKNATRVSRVSFARASMTRSEAFALQEESTRSEAFALQEESNEEPIPSPHARASMPKYLRASMSNLTGGLNRRSNRRSMMQHAQKATEWGEIVWNITSQKTPANAPQEYLIMGMIILWTVVLAVLGFYNHYAPPKNDDGSSDIMVTVIGYVVNIIQIFFYGAPLSRINEVLKTKKSDSIHIFSMITNIMNSGFWFAYGIAPQINDPFIYGPCGVGLVFGFVQIVLGVVFPRTNTTGAKEERFSISTFLARSSISTFLVEERTTHDIEEGAEQAAVGSSRSSKRSSHLF